MKVKVLYFAGLREQVGTSCEDVELPAGVSTLAGRARIWSLAAAYGRARWRRGGWCAWR